MVLPVDDFMRLSVRPRGRFGDDERSSGDDPRPAVYQKGFWRILPREKNYRDPERAKGTPQ